MHTMEGSPHPEQAAKSAERLKTLMPAAGHLIIHIATIVVGLIIAVGADPSLCAYAASTWQ